MSQRQISTELIHKGRIIEIRKDRVQLPDGHVVMRDVVLHPGAVVVLAVTADGRIPFVRQYRYAAGEELLELVAGTVEPGENIAVTAGRELQEEAGYKAGKLTKLGEFYSAPGFCSELLHLYLAEELTESRLPGDEDEQIEVEMLTLQEAFDLARTGKIKDAKTLAGLMLYAAQSGLR